MTTAIHPLSRASASEHTISQAAELSSTDQKTQGVALVTILRGIAIGMACAALIAVVIHPIYTLLVIPAIALALCAEKLATPAPQPKTDDSAPAEPSERVRPKPAPFVEGQPVGIRNAQANCWANSLMQMVAHVPSLRMLVGALGEPVLNDFLNHYDEAGANESHTCKANSQRIRQWLHNLDDAISERVSRHEDAPNAFDVLMRACGNPALFDIHESNTGRLVPDYMLRLSFTDKKNPSLADLMRDYLKNETVCLHDRQVNINRNFNEAPAEFYTQFKRFTSDGRRIGTMVNIPMEYTLPGDYILDGSGDTRYSCDCFIEQRGGMHAGHYIAYVRKADGWWQCDDSTVTKISDADARRYLSRSYMCHFARIDE